MIDTYVVLKAGVYVHDVYGPFFGLSVAIAAADMLAAQDVDDYHTWDVYRLRVVGLENAECEYSTTKTTDPN